MVDIKDYERLPDESDMATVREEQFLAAALEKASRAPQVERTGICLNDGCGEKAINGGLYCGDDCKDEHRREEAIRARQFRK